MDIGSGYFIPYEVLTTILGHLLPHKSIMQCRLVCKMWRNIIENESWRFVIKESKREPYTDDELSKISKMPWFIHHAACAEDSLFGRNFVMTNHPQDTPIWKLRDPNSRSWKIVPTDDESTPEDELSKNADFLVVKLAVLPGVRDARRSIDHIIQLPKSGLSCFIMKKLPPKITISSWFCLEAFGDPDITQYNLYAQLQNVAGTAAIVDRNEVPFNADFQEGEWKKNQITVSYPQSEIHLNALHIAHSLYGGRTKGMVTRIIIRIEKPDFFAFDWNSIFKRNPDVRNESLASLLISEHHFFLSKGINLSGTFALDLLPLFYGEDVGLLSIPESGILIPEFWYGRPISDIIEAENRVVDSLIRYEKGKYLLLYELRCKIHLKRQGLYGFFMDDVQPPIEAYVDETNRFLSNAMKHEIMVSLQDNDGKILHQKKASEILCNGDSKKLSLKFENYGKGVQYIEFSIRRHLSMTHCENCGSCDGNTTFEDHVRNVIRMSRVQVLLPLP